MDRKHAFVARLLATIFAGLAVGSGSGPVVHYFHHAISLPAEVVVGLISGLATWLSAPRVVGAVKDVRSGMQVPPPALAPGLKSHPKSDNKKPVGGAKAPASGKPAVAPSTKTGRTEAKAASQSTASAQQPKKTSGNVELVSQNLEDGSIAVTVTVSGLTNAEFKKKPSGMRARLEKIPGIKWEHPDNLGDGKRQMKGAIASGPKQSEALHSLEKLTGK